jgi:uncharacterized membrane protein YoaK (UPF0700 family)
VPHRAPSTRSAPHRLRHALVVLLTVNAGATDAVGFLALGGAFTSVMTGNLVLFGISGAHGDGTLARHILTAVLCFVTGCVLGGRLAGTPVDGQPVWPAAVTRALGVEFAVLAGCATGWWVLHADPRGPAQLACLGGNAVALGIQSSSVQRFGVPGLSTTYLTGTLTTLVVRLRDVADSLQILAGLVAGAVGAAALVDHLPVLSPLLQLTVVGTVLLASLLLRHDGRGGPGRRGHATAGAADAAAGASQASAATTSARVPVSRVGRMTGATAGE